VNYKLLAAFESLFAGVKYLHRNSTHGDHVASFLVDDLHALGRSRKLVQAVDSGDLVLNVRNKTVGRSHRRGDGTFGTAIPGVPGVSVGIYNAQLGEVANIQIGAEVKILAKAMIKQLDRVGTDMENQAAEFRRHGNAPICIGVVAVNYAPVYRSFEGDKEWITDGRRYKHPIQEATEAERRLLTRVRDKFDELIGLRFVATNMDPLAFRWLDEMSTHKEYGAALVRLSALYDKRY
jgi:hypothetical protein